MSCTLATIAACFSMSGVYATADIRIPLHGDEVTIEVPGKPRHDKMYVLPSYSVAEGPRTPQLWGAIGYSIEPRPWVSVTLIQVSVEHRNPSFGVGVTFRPFAR